MHQNHIRLAAVFTTPGVARSAMRKRIRQPIGLVLAFVTALIASLMLATPPMRCRR